MADLTIERLAKVNIPLNVSNKPNNLSNYNRSTAVYNDSINLKEAIELIVGGGGGGAGTDLTLTRVGNVVTVLSSTGTDVVIPLATTSLAGLLSLEDKLILDNALTTDTLVIGDGLIGDGSVGDPLDWAGAFVTSPITGSGSTFFPLTILANSITTNHIANATILFTDIAQNGASSSQVPQWNGSAWVPASVGLPTGTVGDILLHNGTTWESVSTVREDITGITNINITLASTPISHGRFEIYKNGILQTYTDDFTRSGTLVTFVVTLVSTDKVTVFYNL